jgi:hypothetical protein
LALYFRNRVFTLAGMSVGNKKKLFINDCSSKSTWEFNCAKVGMVWYTFYQHKIFNVMFWKGLTLEKYAENHNRKSCVNCF